MDGRRQRGSDRSLIRLARLARVFVGTLCLAWTPAANAEPLRVGSELDYPPFATVDEAGQPTGFSVELFRAVADVMDLGVTFEVGPWSEVLDGLREGRLDALPFVGMFPDRDVYLDFSVPVVVTHGAVFQHRDAPLIRDAQDLAGKRVAVMRDDVGHEYARTQPWAWNLVAFPSLDEAFDCLALQRCDAVVAPRLQGLLLVRETGLNRQITPAPMDLEGFSLSYAFAVTAGNADLLAALNGGLAIVIADGTLDQLYRTWLPDTDREQGIPLSVLLPYATGILAVFLLIVGILYVRQRHATALAGARGVRLERQAEHLRALAERLSAERARAERARGEADTLIRVMPDLFFRLDADDRYIDCHDPDALSLLPFEAMRGKRYDEVLPPDVAAVIAAALDRMRDTGEVQTVDYVLSLPDGRPHSFEAKVAPFDDGGSLAVIRDVTEARAREAQLRTAAMAIATASAAKSRFLATMSHELRTPLNAVIGFSEVLSKEMFGPLGSDQYRQYARDLHSAGESLLSLVDDLMDIAHIESGKLTLKESVVDLHAILVHKAALLATVATANNTRIDIAPPAGPVRLWADESLVQRMIVNLLSNAVKFTQNGRVEARIEIRSDGRVAIVITDTGIGMTADQLKHLGEPFYQPAPAVARSAEGSGLGVTLVKEMIALHGGDVSHESEVGKGTTASLTFPAARRLADEVVPGPGIMKKRML